MRRNLQFRLHRLLVAIAVLAIVSCIVRDPYQRLQARARVDRGVALIQTYESLVPTAYDALAWSGAIHVLLREWALLPSDERVGPSEREEILKLIQGLVNHADLATA
jgi:hypothetical protein